MTRIRSVLPVTLFVGLSGCTGGMTPPAASAIRPAQSAGSPHATHCARGPAEVVWLRASKAPDGHGGTALTLVADLRAPGGLPAPAVATVDVPRGATLSRGAARFDLGSLAPGQTRRIELELRYPVTPLDDLALHVDARDDSQTFHAVLHHRFGRPEPTLPIPRAAGPDVVFRGSNWGPSHALTRVAEGRPLPEPVTGP